MPSTYFRPPAPAHRSRIGIVSTYPPQVCGLATFAAALGGGLARRGHTVEIVRVRDTPATTPPRQPVVGEIVNGDSRSIHRAAGRLSLCDAVILQHEFGIFGGDDGGEALDLVGAITAPVITVLHTVPSLPTPGQLRILTELCDRSAGVVVMSETARQRLAAHAAGNVERVVVIPHGAVAALSSSAPAHAPRGNGEVAPQLLTWGLIGPGKGIEHAIDALALLQDMPTPPRYTIAGVTHPKVLATSGDRYRQSLIERAAAAGLAHTVHFDATYRDVASLTRFIGSAALVVLPYDSHDQVTSGVLVDSLAAGRPVIATAFPHAMELLPGGAGLVVPHDNPQALADAIRTVWDDPMRLEAMGAAARRIAPTLSWSAVARSYSAQVDLCLARQGTAA